MWDELLSISKDVPIDGILDFSGDKTQMFTTIEVYNGIAYGRYSSKKENNPGIFDWKIWYADHWNSDICALNFVHVNVTQNCRGFQCLFCC